MLGGLAAFIQQRPRRIVAGGVLLMVVGALIGGPVVGLLSASNSSFEDPGTEGVVAREQLEAAAGIGPAVGLIALVRLDQEVRSPAGRERVGAVATVLRTDPAVGRVVTVFDANDPAFISTDGRSTYLVAALRAVSDDAGIDAAERIDAAFADDPDVLIGGQILAGVQVREQVSTDLARAELLAFPILFVLSLFIFRGLVAAALPLLTGGLTILLSLLTLRIVNEGIGMSVFAVNLVIGLSLGLAIDYGLLIVSRYREELARHGPGGEALRATLTTAGRTVLFSSITVAIAAASLLVFPQQFLYSMGVGGLAAAIVAGFSALVVLPAVLALLGERVDALSPQSWRRRSRVGTEAEEAGFWYRLSRAVMRRPGRVALASGALLIVLGLPFTRVEFSGADASTLPVSASARQVSDTLDAEFPPQRGTPIYIALDTSSAGESALTAFASEVRSLPGAAVVLPPRKIGPELWQLDVIAQERSLEDLSLELVHGIREIDTPLGFKVGGFSAAFIDQQDSLLDHIPLALLILALGTLLMIFLATGSVVLPIKALIMNVLTLSATFGLLVLIFQDGRLEGLLDFESQGALEATQPILVFVIAFALSTDYAIFLFTRIKEARDAGFSNTESVARGLERTGRVVTSAALLFAIAIGAFSTSEIVFIKLLGVGTAIAVLLDATLVRALLVPSLMKLLGDWNWWAPGPLRRFGGLEGSAEARAVDA